MAMMLVVNRHTKWRNQWLDGGFIAIVLHTHRVPSADFTNTHTHTLRRDTNMRTVRHAHCSADVSALSADHFSYLIFAHSIMSTR
ncbi:hypothetical protein GHT06_017168 [Daphnia sinensis]|uniref:Uncharacterized protein n=1 Tax=Daphnia sinensis TaxID=1820382 RepID=A0AAD5PUP4_9CRUS|nr:hypothetical protein GHT06_017168 [Daphnia sinensis]